MSTIIIRLESGGVPSKSEPVEKIPLETRVRDMIDCIESGHESAVEWITINKIYKHLEGRTDKKAKAILDMIQPIMSKYGQHGVAK